VLLQLAARAVALAALRGPALPADRQRLPAQHQRAAEQGSPESEVREAAPMGSL
jgi:hypothetical protein